MALSTSERIASARVWRKRYGGGMRQVGILAAAADYAITHHMSDLSHDHRRAKALATAIAQVDSSLIDPTSVATNIVGLNLKALGNYRCRTCATDKRFWITYRSPRSTFCTSCDTS